MTKETKLRPKDVYSPWGGTQETINEYCKKWKMEICAFRQPLMGEFFVPTGFEMGTRPYTINKYDPGEERLIIRKIT